jgi:uncharacterized membrane protein
LVVDIIPYIEIVGDYRMASKTPLNDWAKKLIKRMESNWDEKYQTIFTIVLSFAILIIPFSFSQTILLFSKERATMTFDPMFSAPSLISIFCFYVIVFCVIMLVRNANKSQTNKKLDETILRLDGTNERLNETNIKLDKLTTSVQELVIEIRKDRESRNKPNLP